jgi:hypothetical protein
MGKEFYMKKRKMIGLLGKSAMMAFLTAMLAVSGAATLIGCVGGGGTPSLVSIKLDTPPTKTLYDEGQNLDLMGIAVTGTYSDGAAKPEAVTTADVTGYDKDTLGAQVLSVTVREVTAPETFTVTVISAAQAQTAADDFTTDFSTDLSTPPGSVNTANKADIEAAIAAYDALSDGTKALLPAGTQAEVTALQAAIAILDAKIDLQAAVAIHDALNASDFVANASQNAVPTTKYWVTQAEQTDLTNAKSAADTVLADASATLTQVNDALATLNAALVPFISGKQFGTNDDPITSISSASITGLPAPVNGVGSSTVITGITTGEASYTVESLTWKQGGSTYTGAFAASTVYTADIVLKAAAGYKFSAIIPGTDAGTPAVGTISADSAENTLTFTVTFPATDADVSDTPAASTASVAKATAAQASVAFTLTNSPAYANSPATTWAVYAANTGSGLAAGVSASNSGATLTLAHATDIPATTYYVSATESGKTESAARLALTVLGLGSGVPGFEDGGMDDETFNGIISPPPLSKGATYPFDVGTGYTAIKWSIDGVVFEWANGAQTFTLDAAILSVGTHTLTVTGEKGGKSWSKNVTITITL